MNKLYKYLDKIGADYRRETFGNDSYFYNAPGVAYDRAVVMFEYSHETAARCEQVEKLIRHYARRFGYTVYNVGGWPGARYFSICRTCDFEAVADYLRFRDMSVDECAKISHRYYKYGSGAGFDLNRKLRETMDYYGALYVDFLKAIKTA